MKLLGALLLLGSAGFWCLFHRREAQAPIRLGRALLNDLAIFRYQVQTCRTPLPELLEDYLTDSPAAAVLWNPLRILLSEERYSLPQCWQITVLPLPPPVRKLLAPLGPLLPAGGEPLSSAIEETREELTRYIRDETVRQTAQNRISTALCLAGAGLVILVLL